MYRKLSSGNKCSFIIYLFIIYYLTSDRCHVSLEKSSKNYIRCESEPSQAATHSAPPPHLLAKRRVLEADFPLGEAKFAKKMRHGDSPLLGERAG
jgi:hypothetical protein